MDFLTIAVDIIISWSNEAEQEDERHLKRVETFIVA
jgi:hypothetical protein